MEARCGWRIDVCYLNPFAYIIELHVEISLIRLVFPLVELVESRVGRWTSPDGGSMDGPSLTAPRVPVMLLPARSVASDTE